MITNGRQPGCRPFCVPSKNAFGFGKIHKAFFHILPGEGALRIVPPESLVPGGAEADPVVEENPADGKDQVQKAKGASRKDQVPDRDRGQEKDRREEPQVVQPVEPEGEEYKVHPAREEGEENRGKDEKLHPGKRSAPPYTQAANHQLRSIALHRLRNQVRGSSLRTPNSAQSPTRGKPPGKPNFSKKWRKRKAASRRRVLVSRVPWIKYDTRSRTPAIQTEISCQCRRILSDISGVSDLQGRDVPLVDRIVDLAGALRVAGGVDGDRKIPHGDAGLVNPLQDRQGRRVIPSFWIIPRSTIFVAAISSRRIPSRISTMVTSFPCSAS
jgi:hypothetical protein